ncbi:class I SAM-dependent methyltransferase [uncultured Roseovarius sp.]|uniref:class I SAM-dependent methyltransferase n=1 Tax=uncultured Roseovarius sp. TaxID=293344 RepID=UPI002620589A|nr:class I SAM-dependent methyltransferase [uncultured Roseovarius sp.]
MAIPDTLAARLIETVKDHALSGKFLMLGRQRWIGSRRGPSARLLDKVLETHLPGVSATDLVTEGDTYSEPFFERLGFESVDSMDLSDFEQASVIQDLSAPLPRELDGAFDVIYDGGTCEHIFDLPTAYRNIHKMLKPGGVLIGHSPCNNWVNHSFYQINPEMVYGFWEATLGYEVLRCALQPLKPAHALKVVTTTNPNVTGKRPRLSGALAEGGIILDYAVRKPQRATKSADKVYQSDYLNRWTEAEAGE